MTLRPSQWGQLFDAALDVMRNAEERIGGPFLWSFGGGTALMLQIDHRESHDVDLFVDDVQVMPYLNPVTQEYRLVADPDDYQADGTHATKLIYHGVGEIDFICCGDVLDKPNRTAPVRGVDVLLEIPAEIVAKKITYRGSMMQPRDMFDLAATARSRSSDYVVEALRGCGGAACAAALTAAERFDANSARAVMDRLMLRESMRDLPATAQGMTAGLLRRALA